MGAGASRSKPEPIQAPRVEDLRQPYTKEGRPNEKFIYCLPQQEELQKKSLEMVLEVSRQGFRLLKPGSEDPVAVYPWGQIHSWAQVGTNFAFRYFDDNKRSILQYVLALRDLNVLMDHIHFIIEQILAERRSLAISEEGFAELLAKVTAAKEQARLEMIGQAVKGHYLMADQGRQLMELLPSTFDKVEAAVLLHGRLVDQNRFSHMLEILECADDRENVWHRITLMKKAASTLGASKTRRGTESPGVSTGGGLSGPTSPTGPGPSNRQSLGGGGAALQATSP